MKKYFFIISAVLLCLVAMLLTLDNGQKTETPLTQAPRVYNLRFGHNIQENSALHQAALRFASLVNERTHGQVQVEIFPNQQLGNDHQMIEMARAGELDIILTPTAKLSALAPQMQYVDLPFLFPTREDAYALLDGKVGDLLLRHLKPYGLRGVTIWENGFMPLTANCPPLRIVGARYRGTCPAMAKAHPWTK